MRIRLAIPSLALGLAASAACSPASGPSAQSPTPALAGVPSDSCAGDPWLAQILGHRPEISVAMSVAGMKRTRMYGPEFASRDRVEMDHLGELQDIRSASAEVYEWEGPPDPRSSSGHQTSRVIVLRQAFGDPRALQHEGAPLYAAPTPLANGTLEFAPTKANVDAAFAPTGGTAIFTFADGTWVQVDGWMAPRFRAAFAVGPPPLPPSGPDVAWEVCSLFEGRGATRSGVWGVTPQRGALRFLAGTAEDAEMVYRFETPDLAARAEAEQRARCAQPQYAGGGDKGIFSLTPPCKGVVSTKIDGPMLRYVLRF